MASLASLTLLIQQILIRVRIATIKIKTLKLNTTEKLKAFSSAASLFEDHHQGENPGH